MEWLELQGGDAEQTCLVGTSQVETLRRRAHFSVVVVDGVWAQVTVLCVEVYCCAFAYEVGSVCAVVVRCIGVHAAPLRGAFV